MKMPKRLIASVGVLMLSATPLLHASADQRDDHDHGGPQQGQYDNHGYNRGDDHRGPQTIIEVARHATSARFARPFMTITTTSCAAHRHRRAFVWNVADHSPRLLWRAPG